jgi:very-long-chain enoyl-CoA reductase
MVSVTVSAAGSLPSFARGLPFTVEIAGKEVQNTTIGDVKAAIAAKFPKVRPRIIFLMADMY